jgi:ketopantoate reductase
MRLPRNDWYAYTNAGFQRIGQCTLEIARSQAERMCGEVHMLITAQQLPKLLSRVERVIDYHRDLEEEHTENMRHDAETGREDPDDE